MIRFLIFLLLIFLGYTLFDMIRRSLTGQGRREKPPQKTRLGEDMVRDPHCGTYLPVSDAVSARIEGKTHYFCSKECRDAYKKS